MYNLIHLKFEEIRNEDMAWFITKYKFPMILAHLITKQTSYILLSWIILMFETRNETETHSGLKRCLLN